MHDVPPFVLSVLGAKADRNVPDGFRGQFARLGVAYDRQQHSRALRSAVVCGRSPAGTCECFVNARIDDPDLDMENGGIIVIMSKLKKDDSYGVKTTTNVASVRGTMFQVAGDEAGSEVKVKKVPR